MSIADELVRVLPEHTVAAEVDPAYLGDWVCRAEDVRPAALVRPQNTEQVAAVLRLCNARGAPVVAQGGRTGLAGGATPGQDWVVLSLERMRAVSEPDRHAGVLTAEAGAPLQAVQEAADRAGLLFPLDIGARGSCTIGGNISTNAGGNRVLRYGMMRDLVLGMEAVLADGTVLSNLNGMLKNNTGYDLKQMFIGSEGTLGVVTRAVLRLFPKPISVQTAVCAVADYAALLDLLALAKSRLGPTLAAFEAMWPHFYHLATAAVGRRAPLEPGHGAYVLVEAMGSDEAHDAEAFQAFVEAALEQGIIGDAVIAQSIRETEALWALRDSSGEFQSTFWPYVGFDVSLPIGGIGRFIDTCTERLQRRWPDVQTVWFGHVADSNIHIGVRLDGVSPLPEAEIDEIVYDCVGEMDGSISAEHGIGLLKRAYLDRSRRPEEIAVMRRLKQSLDPNGILNPGKIFA